MENTVLILGAGFSHPYGYPTGSTLVDQIIASCLATPLHADEILAQKLQDFDGYSIDKFLSLHTDLAEAGMIKIAEKILDAEKKSLRKKVESNEDIIKLISHSVEPQDFEHLRIISFNYDRLFEYKFLKKLGTNMSAEEAYELFQEIKIEHIHGRMPLLRGLEFPKSKGLSFNYAVDGASPDHEQYVKQALKEYAVNEFKTIFSADKKPNNKAIEAIKWAKRVFFLGFAYDDLNMAKLGINQPGIYYDWESKYVAGTAHGMNNVNLKAVQKKYPFLENRLFSNTAKTFFEDRFHLTEVQFDSEDSPTFIEKTCCEIYAAQERPDQEKAMGIGITMRVQCPECLQPFNVRYERSSGTDEWIVSCPNISLNRFFHP